MATRKTAAARAATPDPLASAPAPGELQPVGNADKSKVKVYDPIEAGLALMLQKHGHVLTAPPIVTAENRETIHASAMELVKFRTTLEATRVAEKEESLKYGRLVDAEARRIQAQASPIEQAYKNAIASFDNAEAERKQDILKRLGEVRATGQQAIGKSSETLQQILDGLNTLDLATFQEFREQAVQAQLEATRQVGQLLAQAIEAEEARRQLALQQAEQKRLDAIRQRIKDIGAILGTAAMARSSVMLGKLLEQAKAVVIDDSYAELRNDAAGARALAIEQLTELHKNKVQAEADAAEAQRLREAAARAAPAPAPAPAPALSPLRSVTTAAPSPSPGYPPRTEARATVDGLPPGAPRIYADEATPEVQAPAALAVSTSVARELSDMPDRPSDAEIIGHLADHFDDHPLNVIEWIASMDLSAQRERCGQSSLPLAA